MLRTQICAESSEESVLKIWCQWREFEDFHCRIYHSASRRPFKCRTNEPIWATSVLSDSPVHMGRFPARHTGKVGRQQQLQKCWTTHTINVCESGTGTKQWRRDMSTWNVRSMYRSGSLATAVRKLAKYTWDLVGVQEVRWDRDYIFLYGKGNENHQLGTGFFVHHRIVSAEESRVC